MDWAKFEHTTVLIIAVLISWSVCSIEHISIESLEEIILLIHDRWIGRKRKNDFIPPTDLYEEILVIVEIFPF